MWISDGVVWYIAIGKVKARASRDGRCSFFSSYKISCQQLSDSSLSVAIGSVTNAGKARSEQQACRATGDAALWEWMMMYDVASKKKKERKKETDLYQFGLEGPILAALFRGSSATGREAVRSALNSACHGIFFPRRQSIKRAVVSKTWYIPWP